MRYFLIALLVVACSKAPTDPSQPPAPEPGKAIVFSFENVDFDGVVGGTDSVIVEKTEIETALKLVPNQAPKSK